MAINALTNILQALLQDADDLLNLTRKHGITLLHLPICEIACMTVLWSRPPKFSPIDLSE